MRIDQVDRLLAEYHRKYDINLVPIKVDNLVKIVLEKGYVQTIEIQALEYDCRHIQGGVKTFGKPYQADADHAQIFYHKDLAEVERRFVVCKELCHVVLDQGGYKVCSAEELKMLVESLAVKQYSASKPSESERLAVACALELLFPLELRLKHLAAYKSGQITNNQLALRFEIPEIFIEVAMGEQHIEFVKGQIRFKLLF